MVKPTSVTKMNPDLVVHQGSPTKHPDVRLQTIRDAGELKMEVGGQIDGSRKFSGPLSLKLEGPFKSRGVNEVPLPSRLS